MNDGLTFCCFATIPIPIYSYVHKWDYIRNSTHMHLNIMYTKALQVGFGFCLRVFLINA